MLDRVKVRYWRLPTKVLYSVALISVSSSVALEGDFRANEVWLEAHSGMLVLCKESLLYLACERNKLVSK